MAFRFSLKNNVLKQLPLFCFAVETHSSVKIFVRPPEIMRLKCSVDIHNRACAVVGVATICKPTHAQVSIGKKPGSNQDRYLMIATTKDLNGRKFSLKGNVLKAFTKFLQDGKSTIQLKEPAFDIRLSKADPNQLKV